MATIEATKENFEGLIDGHPLVIVDFWAPWCAPCRAFAPVFEAASEQHADVVFVKVNTEAEPELASHFQVRSIPTLMVFREQIILFSQPGSLPRQALDEVITQVQALDMAAIRREIADDQASDPGDHCGCGHDPDDTGHDGPASGG